MIDFNMLSERLRGNKSLMEKILSLFVSQYKDIDASIQSAYLSKDTKAIHEMTHKLRGSCGTMCSSESLNGMEAIEMTAKDGVLPEKTVLDDLSNQVSSMVSSIEEYLVINK